MQKSRRAKRIEKRRNRTRHAVGKLNLISLVDTFTMLVVFLLMSPSDGDSPPARDIQLPQSIAEETPGTNVVVFVSEDRIVVQGESVATVADALSMSGNEIPALREALLAQNKRELGGGDDDIAGRAVTIMGDKDIPYRLLKKVMATCTAADYGRISLAVLQKSPDLLAASH